ncbi:helix-turn-helix domain-containing protein [Moorella sp. ACPs]|uniref:helix-turn-helix domain-containing protein n=1 Tax=Neomoorella carbonis TaxID=3062783 RepID=UPI0032475619
MEKVGEVLRSARQAKGLSLREVEEATKIRLRYLEALENGEYNQLPGRVYALGFVRSYARYLGLDVQAVVQQFKQEYPTEEDNSPVEEQRLPARGYAREKRRHWLLVPAVLLVLWGINWLYNHYRPSFDQSASPPQPQVTEPAPVTPAPQQPVTQPPPVGTTPQVQGVEVKVRASGDCWMGAEVDGKKDFAGILKAGESRVLQGKEKITVTLGSAGAVEVTINGQVQPPLGRVGDVVTFEATKDSSQAKITRKR